MQLGRKIYIIGLDIGLDQGSQTRGPRGPFVRPAILFGNFQMINISLPSVLKKDSAK